MRRSFRISLLESHSFVIAIYIMRYGLESILSEDCDVKLYEGTYLEPCVSGTSDILYSSHPYRSSPIYARSHLEFPELDTQ